MPATAERIRQSMAFLTAEIGELVIETKFRDITPSYGVHEIVAVQLEGPPIVRIGEHTIRELLPAWAKSSDDMFVQLGPYVLRRTEEFSYPMNAYYWVVVGQGEMYWHYWRVMRFLDQVWRRILMTLAVWGLANWPPDYRPPTWRDVVERWKK